MLASLRREILLQIPSSLAAGQRPSKSASPASPPDVPRRYCVGDTGSLSTDRINPAVKARPCRIAQCVRRVAANTDVRREIIKLVDDGNLLQAQHSPGDDPFNIVEQISSLWLLVNTQLLLHNFRPYSKHACRKWQQAHYAGS